MVNDIVQIGVVAKNELIKCVRGRKFLISFAMVVLVFLLVTALQFITDSWDSITSMGSLASTYLNTLPIVIALIVALLSSIALVSEFEERTALILFTRPIRRTTILLGKILSCVIIEAMIIAVYYILVGSVGLSKVDDMSIDILTSYGFALLYAFSASGIAFVISAFFKKGSVCTIICLLLLLVIMPIISSMLGNDGGENWFMIDKAADTIYTCIPEYVDNYNATVSAFSSVVESATGILEGFTDSNLDAAKQWLAAYMSSPDFAALDPSVQMSIGRMAAFLNLDADGNLSGMIMVLKMLSGSSLITPMENPDLCKEALVLIAWGIAGYFIAWIRFIRREF